MKNKFFCAGVLALLATASIPLETQAATNGVILITTRFGQDISLSSGDLNDIKGPGQVSPGDAAMSTVLAQNGYSSRYLIDVELNPTRVNPVTGLSGNPEFYIFPSNTNFNASLIINSGTSGSADIGAPNTNGVPIMMGEHSCISDVGRPSHNSLYMYHGANNSDDVKDTEPNQGASQYMVVIATNHPIMQGIPLDAQGRVKIFRDPFPEENSHVPLGGKPNYEYAWTTIDASLAAPGTTVIGLLGGNTNRACFAVADIGAQLANGSADPDHPWQIAFGDNKAHQRLVHWMVNDQGSGGARRCFTSMTEVGRLIFIRTVKWAIGEPLAPAETFKVIDVTPVGRGTVQIRWQGSALKHYQLLANADLNTTDWKTVVEDIPGTDGIVSRTFDFSAAPQTLFMRIKATP
ncbi:MAG: hypothetical protein ABIQ35_06340 [Verrucomicrobiota bacterium]